MLTLHRIAYRADTKNNPVYYVDLSDMWLSTLENGAAQFRSVTDIAPKSPPFLLMNRSLIQSTVFGTTSYKFHRFSSDIWNRMMFCAFWKWQMELGGFFLKLYSVENSLIEVWNVRGPYFDV